MSKNVIDCFQRPVKNFFFLSQFEKARTVFCRIIETSFAIGVRFVLRVA